MNDNTTIVTVVGTIALGVLTVLGMFLYHDYKQNQQVVEMVKLGEDPVQARLGISTVDDRLLLFQLSSKKEAR